MNSFLIAQLCFNIGSMCSSSLEAISRQQGLYQEINTVERYTIDSAPKEAVAAASIAYGTTRFLSNRTVRYSFVLNDTRIRLQARKKDVYVGVSWEW